MKKFNVAILGATGLREDHMLGTVFRLVDFTATVPDTVLYSDFGTEITCNEKFLCEIMHNAELADLLCDLTESAI